MTIGEKIEEIKADEKFKKRKEKSVQRCLNRECNEIDISKLNERIRLFV